MKISCVLMLFQHLYLKVVGCARTEMCVVQGILKRESGLLWASVLRCEAAAILTIMYGEGLLYLWIWHTQSTHIIVTVYFTINLLRSTWEKQLTFALWALLQKKKKSVVIITNLHMWQQHGSYDRFPFEFPWLNSVFVIT